MSRTLGGLATLWIALVAPACERAEVPVPVYQVVPVERRDIVVSAEAPGTVRPAVTVEVKSKASGEILELHASTGDVVEEGTLLVRIDQRQPRNALAEAEAELAVAQARLANASAQLRRARELHEASSLSDTALDQAVLDHAVAKAEVVRAEVVVENARIELDDTDVLAPISGTILRREVARGQVISSPTRDVAGGTLLLTMANLERVQVVALVDETDIGKIRRGLSASVTVAAYPGRLFTGEVVKIEPQSLPEQEVTVFPVQVNVDNREALLRPGMNCQVEFEMGRREGVLAIPDSALRTERDVESAAQVLGMSEHEVRAQLGEPGANGAASGEPGAACRSDYIVFVLRDGRPKPVRVKTGLGDFSYSEVCTGLSEEDSVLLLPSASLIREQQQVRERIDRLIGNGGLPGLRSSSGR